MDAYDFKPGGSLKLKGEKKKKKKSYTDDQRQATESEIQRAAKVARVEGNESGGEEVESPGKLGGAGDAAAASGSQSGRKKTPAEEKFDRIQSERRQERASKKAKQTHKDRVAEFNASLDRLSEHHDMPRIGPG